MADATTGTVMTPTDTSLISNAIGLIGGVTGAQSAQQMGQAAATAANPFTPYNAQFGSQLAATGAGPNYASQIANTALPANLGGQMAATGAGLSGQLSQVGSTASAMGGVASAAGDQASALSGVGSQYASLLADPSSLYNTATYQAESAQGQQALNRTLAANGQTESGAEAAALQQYGMANSQSYLNSQLSNLSTAYGQEGSMLGTQTSALSGQQNAYNAQSSNLIAGEQAAMSGLTNQSSANQQNLSNQMASISGQEQQSQQQFANLSNLSGLSGANEGAAGVAMGSIYGNAAQAGSTAGTALSGLLNNSTVQSGASSLLNGIGSLLGGSSSTSLGTDLSSSSSIQDSAATLASLGYPAVTSGASSSDLAGQTLQSAGLPTTDYSSIDAGIFSNFYP